LGAPFEREEDSTLKELLRTNDPVLLSFATTLLASERIDAVVLDGHTSVLEGSVGAIQRRLMVPDADLARARELLKASGALKDRV
jgi:hypothetical protein